MAARPRSTASARAKADAFVPCPEPPLKALRTLIAESRIELPDSLPPMAAGVFGYLGYDMVRLMEELPPPNPDPIGIPDAMLVRPTIIVVFDAVKDSITVVTPVRPEKSVDAKTALRARGRAPGRRRRKPRPPARQILGRIRRRSARGAAALEHHAGRIQGDGAQGQGLHRRRRHRSRSCWRSASRRHSRCRRSRSIARCGGPIRRRSSTSSTSAASPSPARARKSWCACATTR